MAPLVFAIIILLVVFFWPQISSWIRRFMARRAESVIRRMFGMPSRKEEERARRNYQEKTKQTQERQRRENAADDIVKAMHQYAEDVDFVEIKEEDAKNDTRM